MRSLKFISVAFLSSIAVWAAVAPGGRFSKQGPSNVVFNASATGGLKIEGQTADLEIRDDGASLAVIVPLNHLSTGIALRDRHMREKYLETEKYPNAELRFRRDELKVPAAGGREEASAKAALKLHGQEKPVVVNYRASESDGLFNVEGALHLNIADFGISTPSFMGVSLKPDVDVKASFRLAPSAPAERTPGAKSASE